MLRIKQEALTFDDVLLVPAHSTVLPNTANLSTKLTKEISLNTSNNKQVWVITKGKTQVIKDSDNILVKEIALNSLIDVLEERLSNLKHDNLMAKLLELGE